MRFRSVASPPPSLGTKVGGPKLTRPDQSMSLEEILARFVREQPLPIDNGMDTFGRDSKDSEVYPEDLEKVSHMDMVDKQEFIDRQKDLQKKFDRQEKEKERKRLEKVRAEERERIAREEAAKAAAKANN